VSRHDNEETTTLDLVLLFSMPGVIAVLCGYLWFVA
jgi:hypothetical protein